MPAPSSALDCVGCCCCCCKSLLSVIVYVPLWVASAASMCRVRLPSSLTFLPTQVSSWDCLVSSPESVWHYDAISCLLHRWDKDTFLTYCISTRVQGTIAQLLCNGCIVSDDWYFLQLSYDAILKLLFANYYIIVLNEKKPNLRFKIFWNRCASVLFISSSFRDKLFRFPFTQKSQAAVTWCKKWHPQKQWAISVKIATLVSYKNGLDVANCKQNNNK